MRLLVATDHHFLRCPDGNVYLGHPMSLPGYKAWEDYLRVFEEVVVLARVRTVRSPATSLRADGPRVSFRDLPDYLGPWQYLRALPVLGPRVRQAVTTGDAILLKVPAAIGQLAWKAARKQGRACSIEVISDPWDMYAPGAVPSVVRPLLRRRWSRELREMCLGATAVSYVTREALQRRYPPGPQTWATYISDVNLAGRLADDERLLERLNRLRAKAREPKPEWRIGFLGSLAQMTKAPDVLLQAVADCAAAGANLKAVLAGDGKYRAPMEELARNLGLGEQAEFLGALVPGVAVVDFLDSLDLFVLPSRTEGLPRALIEAMARGCPCLGSNVGGIPELLAPEDLVPPGDAVALSRKIRDVLADSLRMERMARRDWEAAREFEPQALDKRRLEFCHKIRERTR